MNSDALKKSVVICSTLIFLSSLASAQQDNLGKKEFTFSESVVQITNDSQIGFASDFSKPNLLPVWGTPVDFYNSVPIQKWIGTFGRLAIFKEGGVVQVENSNNKLSQIFSLSQNYPNPFNPVTNIKFQNPSTSYVSLKVYDILGREFVTLLNEEKSPGDYEVRLKIRRPTDDPSADGRLSSGIYFYQLRAGDFVSTKKMILMK